MKLSYNSNGYVKYSIEKTIESLGRLGYEGIEIARTHPVHELSKQKRKKLLEMIKSHGLQVSAVQGGTPCLDVEFAKARIDLAVDLECPIVNLGPGLDVVEEKKRGKYWKEVVEGFKKLATYAKNKGITVVMEAEPPTNVVSGRVGRVHPRLIATLADMKRMLADVRAENFAILLDIGHMYCVKENVLNVIEQLSEKIVHVHIEDIVDRIHCHFIPGTGMVDFEGTVKTLDKVGYKGFLSVELEAHMEEPEKAALETIQYFDSLLDKTGLE